VIIDTVVDSIHAVGTLRPNEAVVVSPEIPGRIARIGFNAGDRVAQGDVLVELDSEILRAELAKADSDMTLAEANRERAMTLARQGTGTLRARDEAVAAFRVAQANRELARARLSKATIEAPFSGILGFRTVSVGAYVTPGDTLVELADIDPIKIDFRVPELVLASIRRGQTIRVLVDAVPGATFDGTVYAIDPIVDENGRAIRMRAEVPNPDAALFPGLFARVQILAAQRENAVLVPESAVFSRGGAQYVFRVVDGTAAQTRVDLGQRRPGAVEITQGLSAGDIVITAGQEKVRDKGPVDVLPTGGTS
jgi:membrane fusion protein (multidrug efflux system)